MSEFFTAAFEKFVETPVYLWISLAALVILTFAIALLNRRRWSARMMVTGAMCLALSFVLSCIRLYSMPQGGSLTPASMLPVMMFAYCYGFGPGLLAGTAYGLLQMLQDFYFLNPMQLLFDYIFAFASLAACAVFRNALPKAIRLGAGVVLAAALRFIFHTLVGAWFFAAEYAPGMNPWVYSIGYNSFVGIDGAICLVIALLPPVTAFIENMRRRVAPPKQKAKLGA